MNFRDRFMEVERNQELVITVGRMLVELSRCAPSVSRKLQGLEETT